MSVEAYKQAKEQIAQLENELAEFQASSRELEKELEMELEESEQKHKHLNNQVESLTAEVSEWKNKHLELQKEYSANQSSLMKQISTLKEKYNNANERLREIEMANDDMERYERITKTSLDELEKKYHDSLEEIALLESEVSGKEDLQVDLQRTKDELRDTKEELSVAQTKIDTLQREKEDLQNSNQTLQHKLSTSNTPRIMKTGGGTAFRVSSDPSSHTNNQQIEIPAQQQPQPMTPLHEEVSTTNAMAINKMSSSKSLRKIHGMLDQMRNLEYRVAHFKSSLPKPASPNSTNSSGGHSRSNSNPASPNTGSPRRTFSNDNNNSPIDSSSPNSQSQLPVLRRSSSILDRQFLYDSVRNSPPLLSATLKQRDGGKAPQNTSTHTTTGGSSLDVIEGSPSTSANGKNNKLGEQKENDSNKPPPPKLNFHAHKTSVSNAVQSYDKMVNNTGGSKRAMSPTEQTKVFNRPGSAFSALHSRTGIGHGRFV